MSSVTITVLRIVIAIALAGSVVVQAVILPLLWSDLDSAPTWARIALIGLAFAGVVCMQVFGVCVWILLTKVRRGSVFTEASFTAVHVLIGAIAAASLVTLGVAVVLAIGPAAPGIVGLVCGAALVLAGVALLVVVMKTLLQQAIAREREARMLRSELDEVI